MIKTWLKKVVDDMKMQKNYAKSIFDKKRPLYAFVQAKTAIILIGDILEIRPIVTNYKKRGIRNESSNYRVR